MQRGLRSLAVVMALLIAPLSAGAQQSSDPRIADVVRTGQVKIGTFPPQYTKDSKTGELQGPYIEMYRALAAHMGVKLVVTELPTPKALVDCLNSGGCDVGSLGFDPARADQVGGFTPPFMVFGYTYLVPANSAIRSQADADKAGVKIAVVRGHASTLALARILKNAEQIVAETPDAAFELLRSDRVHAWASAGPALIDYSAELPGSRVVDGSFGANYPALVVPKGRQERLSYLSDFVEQAKASGVMQNALDRAGHPGFSVAPPGGTKR